MTLILACGLKREARILERPGRDVRAVVGGGVAAKLEADLDEVAGMFPGLVMSCGIAGALDPSLLPGDLVIDGDAALVEHLRRALPQAVQGRIVGSDTIVATTAAKRALADRTGGVAVDMESHVAARVAKRRNLPFAAIRTISDRAGDDLPAAALVGMRPDGGMALGAVLGSLARAPGQLPDLLRTGRQADAAFRSLDKMFEAIIHAGIDRLDISTL